MRIYYFPGVFILQTPIIPRFITFLIGRKSMIDFNFPVNLLFDMIISILTDISMIGPPEEYH